MADTCNCSPAINLQSSFIDINNEIYNLASYFTFPECQILPNGERVSNPFYDTANNISYYTYQYANQCGMAAVSSVEVPICGTIPVENVIVEGRFGICPDFVPLSIIGIRNPGGEVATLEFDVEELQDGAAPAIYRVAIVGRYEMGSTSVQVPFVELADNDGGPAQRVQWPYASCPQAPRITLFKECRAEIESNNVTVVYDIVLSNTGNEELTNVVFTDQISYPSVNINVDTVTVMPADVAIDVTVAGIIRLTQTIEVLGVGQSITYEVRIRIGSFTQGGLYSFANMAQGQSGFLMGMDNCTVNVNVQELSPRLCCTTFPDTNRGSFSYGATNSLTSPETEVRVIGTLSIPSSLQIQFVDFGNCLVTFTGTQDLVSLLTPLSGISVTVDCVGSLPSGGIVEFPIEFQFLAANFNSEVLTATVEQIILILDNTVNIRANELPINQIFTVDSSAVCQSF